MVRWLSAVVSVAVVGSGSFAQDAVAAKARGVLEAHCYVCHGKEGKRAGGFANALDVPQMVEKGKIKPGDAANSRIFERLAANDEAEVMPPPEAKDKPTADEIAAVKAWIDAGAKPFPAAAAVTAKRPYLTEKDTLRAMHDYLAKHTDHAKYLRFLTLTHLFNDDKADDAKIRLYQAGVSKLLNSLSWRKGIIQPTIADTHGALLAFDLRDLDWDVGGQWNLILARDESKKYGGYVYGLTHDKYPENEELNLLAKQVYDMAGTRMPAVRADWFLAAASLPPLYHDLLNLPDTDQEVERRLGVDVKLNYRRETLARVGLGKSGVADKANRVLERHEGVFGYYHKSYDFEDEAGTGNIVKNPLGPLNLFPAGKHPYEERAFVHAGGEMIWSLPNGLQAYLLVNGAGKRIDKGPPIVVDDKRTVGDGTTIHTGLSCMACHKNGMITDFQETTRAGLTFPGDAGRKARRLYVNQEAAQKMFAKDAEQFTAAVEKACGPFLRVGADEKKPLGQFPEPISAIASPYIKGGLTLEQAARELGIADVKELKIAIENNPALRDRLSLAPLANGGTVARKHWESKSDTGDSVFQNAAAELKRGSPRIEGR